MSFTDRLAEHVSDHILTDGRRTVKYSTLPSEFERLDKLWRRQEFPRGGVVALRGQNDLATAIAVLHLLSRKRACYFWRSPMQSRIEQTPWSELPEYCTVILRSENRDSGTTGDAARLEYAVETRPRVSIEVPTPSEPYIYLGTSGTTAEPKLAVYTPERLLRNAENCVRRFELTAEDRVLLPLPLAHMYGLGAAFLPAILAGAAVYLLPQTNLLTVLEAERRFDPTVAFLTPGLAHQLISVRKHPRPYRLSVLGADRMNHDLFARYEERHGCTVCVYGSTELGAVAASHPHDTFNRRQQSSGPLLNGVEIVPSPMESDTLCFRHPFAMSGYANAVGEPELPPTIFRDSIYLTRDVGGLDELGDLRVQGRIDDCVKRDGYLVAFSHVEQQIEQLPRITRVIVLAGATTPRGPELVAFCVFQPGHGIDEQQLRERALELIPTHAIPDRFIPLEQLPLTATGKPDRQALRSLIKES